MATETAQRALEPLTVEECMALLDRTYLGRLAYVADGRPRIVPLNFLYDRGTVLVRIGYGTLLDAVQGAHVVFEIDGVDPLSHTGWSVIVTGVAEEVWQPDQLDVVRDLPLRPWAPGERDHYVRIAPSAITGRRIGRRT
ncbi:pyridoxamine 5'-phosphate oxidase family protein [Euzebya sp.]|uniref:pyridoxamine 5'-phosphate oxidase family protein n=1 Tax=Euzebya sp. TaxID=1971409 RepID=UPI0035137D18